MVFVCHAQKFTKTALKGLEIHNEREEKYTLSNKDIDKTKSCENYHIGECHDNYVQRFNELREEKVTGIVRSNSVAAVGIVISADKEFFDNLDTGREKEYFESVHKKISDLYGQENIISATVHKDEATPHMHIIVVPITEDGRLSAKELFNRDALKSLQDIAVDLQDEGFEIERGQINSENKHLSEEKFKIEQENQKLELERENLRLKAQRLQETQDFFLRERERFEELKKSREKISSIVDEVMKNETFIYKNLYKIDGLQLGELADMAAISENSLKELRSVKRAYRNLSEENENLRGYKEKFEEIEKEYKELKSEVKKISKIMDKMENLGFTEEIACSKTAIEWDNSKYDYQKRDLLIKIGKKPDDERNEVEKKLIEQNKNAKYLSKGFERDDGFER